MTATDEAPKIEPAGVPETVRLSAATRERIETIQRIWADPSSTPSLSLTAAQIVAVGVAFLDRDIGNETLHSQISVMEQALFYLRPGLTRHHMGSGTGLLMDPNSPA